MKIHRDRQLILVVSGNLDLLQIRCMVSERITPEVEVGIGTLPQEIMDRYNASATRDEVIDFASPVTIDLPAEFEFWLSLEHLGRLSREDLISLIPSDVQIWAAANVPISDLWLGGPEDSVKKDERHLLWQEMAKLWALPIEGKVFAVDPAFSEGISGGIRAAVRERDGISHTQADAGYDYYVSDRLDPPEAKGRVGKARVLTRKELTIMIERGLRR